MLPTGTGAVILWSSFSVTTALFSFWKTTLEKKMGTSSDLSPPSLSPPLGIHIDSITVFCYAKPFLFVTVWVGLISRSHAQNIWCSAWKCWNKGWVGLVGCSRRGEFAFACRCAAAVSHCTVHTQFVYVTEMIHTSTRLWFSEAFRVWFCLKILGLSLFFNLQSFRTFRPSSFLAFVCCFGVEWKRSCYWCCSFYCISLYTCATGWVELIDFKHQWRSIQQNKKVKLWWM